jgi:hypothetical protein
MAYAIDKSPAPFKFPCEDIGTYYNDLQGLDGTDLAKRLNSIVSPHHSLPYKKVSSVLLNGNLNRPNWIWPCENYNNFCDKQVWEALKVIDAAEIEHPEISSEVWDEMSDCIDTLLYNSLFMNITFLSFLICLLF